MFIIFYVKSLEAPYAEARVKLHFYLYVVPSLVLETGVRCFEFECTCFDI